MLLHKRSVRGNHIEFDKQSPVKSINPQAYETPSFKHIPFELESYMNPPAKSHEESHGAYAAELTGFSYSTVFEPDAMA